MMYNYVAYTLKIKSEIAFPELLLWPVDNTSALADVVIRLGRVSPHGISSATSRGLTYQLGKYAFWLYVPNVAYFLVNDGHEIIVEPLQGSEEDSIRVFLLEACFAALLMQRAIFLIRGCVIQIDEFAVAFVGDYGLCQSTLLINFIHAGYSVIADGICAIDSHGNVLPSFPQVHLWPDAIPHVGDEPSPNRVLRPGLEKVSVSILESFQPNKLPLRAIYNLSINNLQINRFTSLYSIQKIQCIEKSIYRKYLIEEMGLKSTYFKRVVELAQQVIMADIERYADNFKVVEWIDWVKKDLINRYVDHVHE